MECEKKRYLIVLHEEVVKQVFDIQETLVGSTNLSGLIEMLLNKWCEGYKRVPLE